MGGPGNRQSAVLKSGQDLPQSTRRPERLPCLFGVLFGAFLGLALLKSGNPPIMENWVSAPTQFWEFVFGFPWPANWAYWMLGILALLGLAAARWQSSRAEVAHRPAAGLADLGVHCRHTIGQCRTDQRHTEALRGLRPMLLPGVLLTQPSKNSWLWWAGLFCGLLLVLEVGWDQHFGGLQATRRYFYAYVYGQMKVPPEYLKRISSSRIFATLFYPNALAGLLLVILPGALGVIWDARRRLTAPARGLLMLMLAALALACLYWSGSKGGWLLMLLLGLLVLLRLPFNRQLKRALVAAVLVAGLAGFFWKYASFFEKGATSVGARFDYWRAALQTAWSQPGLRDGSRHLRHPLCRR